MMINRDENCTVIEKYGIILKIFTHTQMNKVFHWKVYGQNVIVSRGRTPVLSPKQGINQF